MTEARKLGPSTLPDIPVAGVNAPRSGDPVPIRGPASDLKLPPLPTHDAVYGDAELAVSAAPSRPSRPSTAGAKKTKKKGSFGRTLLILFLIGFTSFAGGAGLTAGIVIGNFDMKSGKVKEALQGVKTFIQQMRN